MLFRSVPEGIDVVIHSNGDVGDLNIDLDSLTVLEIDASTNVGDIVLNSNQDQSKLSYIETKSDVGDLHTTLNGEMNLLEQIVAGTATGQIDININGSFESAIDVKANSDVGDIRLDFDGDYDKTVTVIVASSVGDLDLFVPRKHEIVLDAHTTEFTSKLEIDDMPFAKSKSIYTIEGEKSTFNIDLTVTVGEAAVKYSN